VSPPPRLKFRMASELDLLIQAGHDITSIKYYALATGAILFYDHLLTLADEVKYIWSGKKSWIFWLFVVNRYFPITYQIWLLELAYSLNPDFNARACEKSAWYPIFAFVICTLLAQVVLTVRIYAVASKNIPVTIAFATITISQLALGIRITVVAAREGAQILPPLPFDAYHLCVFVRHRPVEIAYTSISICYDFLAFSLIIFVAATSKSRGLRFPTILRAMAEDATWYFLVIFTSHFVLEMTLNLGRESIQLLPASGNVVYLPVMISRLMLSLRKTAGTLQEDWSFAGTSASSTYFRSMKFIRPRRSTDGGQDDVSLGTYPELEMTL